MEWRVNPTVINRFPDGVDYVMGMDETGVANHKGIIRKLSKNQEIDINDKHFTLTGIVLDKSNHLNLLKDIRKLKLKYWHDGRHDYKGTSKVICLHSREIRKKEGPFKLEDGVYTSFLGDLTDMIVRQKFDIYSTTINKEDHCRQYLRPYHPYQLAAEFLLERYSIFLNRMNKNGIIILESRGKKEDKFVLKHLINILDKGNSFNSKKAFRRVKGVYFNKKWSERNHTYPILEIADLVSYPIFKYVRSNFEKRDRAFESIEDKFSGYPDYYGKGMKIFPENRKAATAVAGRSTGRPPIHLK